MDWRAFAKKMLLADGTVNEAEALALRRAILVDGKVSRDEAAFVLELKKEARAVHPDFARFAHIVLGQVLLRDGIIDPSEVDWLRSVLLADGRVEESEVGVSPRPGPPGRGWMP
jgi:uncharacterized tellurite resistance protein B-like protein